MTQAIMETERIYRDTSQPTAVRVQDLVARMTLEEKISQMLFTAPAIDRLDIAKHNWWNEGLHGLGRAGVATVFPQAIGLAATWNAELMHDVATAVSDEARAKHHKAVRLGLREMYTGLTYWSPNINIFRDPRWGRGQETYGEDPYLTAKMGVAFVKGLQGNDPHYLKLVATPKHYAVHSGPESLRHHFDARINEQDMREFYLFAFEAAVKEAKAASIMGAYNRTNGEPCCASPTLLEKILRQEWGFDGYVVSDCEAIRDIFTNHKVVHTAPEAAALAVTHGCELNCGRVYAVLLDAVAQGLIDEATIDQAVTRLFKARFQLGMFDPPEMVPYAQIPFDVIDSPAHRALALRAAQESIVLLKNEGGLLPLRKDIGSIAVIGSNADDLQILLGNYHGTPATAVTPLQGIRQKVSPETIVYHAPGCAVADGMPRLRPIPTDYLRPITPIAAETGLNGRYYPNAHHTGQPQHDQVDSQINFTWKDTNPLTGVWGDHFSIQWDGYLLPPTSGDYHLGIYGFSEYRLYLDGALIVDNKMEHHPILKHQTVHLEAGRFYRLQLAYANEGLDPQIQLLWAVPGVDDEAKALEAAQKAEVVVMVMGLSPQLEGEEMPIRIDGFAGGDRTDIKLPAVQENLLQKIHALGKPVVLVLTNGSAVAINWAAANIPAIVDVWYPGQAGGLALADVLFGDFNPAGRLPVTFYKSVDDLPPFEDYELDGRTYRYFHGEPLFPFGHGLSYTHFNLENLQIGQTQLPAGGKTAISLDVTNTGPHAGAEVVQLYIRQTDGRRQALKLQGFKRLFLEPGQCQTVTFNLHSHQLGLYDKQLRYVVEPQTVEVLVGRSAQDLPLAAHLSVVGAPVDATDSKVFFSEVVTG
ncbi:MAG: glycoside hydrolase family 3 C-terminal domain-containing protein [Chloroflexi bacterium]|nr:glycoside hydrolase family 3 C-terminal domain-containing protein [Chloroflexota bacterium]MBP7042584.1 glycoside hydrolase family 3 C-terminal domain-containing protein [Chloroflexota bacterium]